MSGDIQPEAAWAAMANWPIDPYAFEVIAELLVLLDDADELLCRTAALNSDCRAYRELALSAMDALSNVVAAHDRLVEQNRRLREECRALRARVSRGAQQQAAA